MLRTEAAILVQLPTAKHLQTTQEMNITRKRKPTSPLRPANDSKRPATSAATKQTSVPLLSAKKLSCLRQGP